MYKPNPSFLDYIPSRLKFVTAQVSVVNVNNPPDYAAFDSNIMNLPWLSTEEWRSNVQQMVDIKEPLQLIPTFNEFGEGHCG